MLELYCDAVVDLLSKGASPEAHSLPKKNATKTKWRNTQLVDFCVMFFGLHDSWFLRRFIGLNTVFHKKNIFKKINIKNQAKLQLHWPGIFTYLPPPTPNEKKQRCHRRSEQKPRSPNGYRLHKTQVIRRRPNWISDRRRMATFGAPQVEPLKNKGPNGWIC